jgi:carboxylate-amine ligase
MNSKLIKDYSVGIEEEYMLCNPKTGDLTNKASIIMNHFNKNERYSYELLESEIEANTSVHLNIRDAINELSILRTNLGKLGKSKDFTLGISGTHPTADPLKQTFINNESYSWVQNQLNYYAQRNMTFSTHVHINIPDFTNVITIMNSVRRWVAPLLAISANSPFFSKVNTGMKSSRTMQFSSFPRTNIPEKFLSLNDYINYTNKLLEINSIEKHRHIWWKIRPHLDYKTLEFRICDAQRSLKNVGMIAALSRAIVHTAYQEYKNNTIIENLSLEYLNDSLWKATRFNFDSLIYDEVLNQNLTMKEFIEKMCNYCEESLNFFGDSNVINQVNNILKNGTEGDQQNKIYEKGGFEKLKLYLINDVDYSIEE